jgi:serine/threonine protein kinase
MKEAQQTLGRYRILAELGRGAMGAVYRAVDPLIEREVAVKTLLPNLPEELVAEVRERFLREARSAGRLKHPNIVTIYDVGEHEGTAYIAMELLEGESLQQVLRSGEPLPFARAADIAAQVADALDHAQRFSIVHRDIKPANIMFDGDGRPKLADFGLARLPSSSMTQTGDTLGSPKYMSPEQVLGQPADTRADIFALGIVLYEMLTGGRSPFARQHDNAFSLMHRISTEPHRPLAELRPGVPAGLARVVERALAKKPADRYPRAAEMASALRNYKGVADKDVTQTLVMKKQIEQRDSAALLGDLDSFAANFEREQQARAEEEAREQSRRLQEKTEVESRWQLPPELLVPEPRREEPKPAPKAEAPSENLKRKAVLEKLQQQAKAQPVRESPEKLRDRAIEAFDAAMREADRFLVQVANQINSVRPATSKPSDFLFIGRVPSVALSDCRVRARYERVHEREVFDSLKVEYRAMPVQPHTVTLHKDDIGHCIRYLKSLHVEHTALAERRNDFGVPIKAQITVTGAFPCEITLATDYEAFAATVELSGVRRIGRWRARVEQAGIEAAIDDLVHYILGEDDAFEKLLSRAS